MALNYSISMRSSNPMDPEAPKKAYAMSQFGVNVSLKTMSKRIASQTTVARADVMAVLTALVDNIFEVLREGNQVDLGELGKLRLQICCEGANTLKEFTSDFITGVNIQFVPGEDLKNIFAGMEFNPVPTRAAAAAVLRAQKEGQTTVDISPKSPASDSDPEVLAGVSAGSDESAASADAGFASADAGSSAPVAGSAAESVAAGSAVATE